MPQIPISIPRYRRGRQHQFACRSEMKNAQNPTQQKKAKKHFGSLFLAWVLLFSGVGLVFA